MKLGHVALDGTKIKANASKHKAMSYKRMKEEEARLEAEVKELLKKAEAVDEEEDQRYGNAPGIYSGMPIQHRRRGIANKG